MALKRLAVWRSDGTAELYVQIDVPGATLAEMYDRLQADLERVTAERDALQRRLDEREE